MSIQLAILGIVSWKSSTGYEIKKILEDSSFMYWSGNYNQICKALMNMENEDLIACEVIHQDNSPSKKYIELISTTKPLSTENDALDLIALCWEHEANVLIIHYAALSEEFFKLKTKVAGNIIQKFINYGIKAAIIVPQETIQKGRFKEMAMETNKGNHFRLYESKEEAVKWLQK